MKSGTMSRAIPRSISHQTKRMAAGWPKTVYEDEPPSKRARAEPEQQEAADMKKEISVF